MSLKFIDLFAGIGGIRLAMEKAGAKCIYSNEIDKFTCFIPQFFVKTPNNAHKMTNYIQIMHTKDRRLTKTKPYFVFST